MVAGRSGRGTARSRHRARRRTNWEASGLQRPPTSERSNSGLVPSLALRARPRAAPWYWRWCRRAAPLASRGGTRVVSTASCSPPQSGSPFAMTSMRRSSRRSGWMLRSRTRTLWPQPCGRHGQQHAREGAHGSARCQNAGKQRGGHREGRQDGGSDKLRRRQARASEGGGATKRGKQASPRRARGRKAMRSGSARRTVHTETQAGPGKEGQALRGSGRRCFHR